MQVRPAGQVSLPLPTMYHAASGGSHAVHMDWDGGSTKGKAPKLNWRGKACFAIFGVLCLWFLIDFDGEYRPGDIPKVQRAHTPTQTMRRVLAGMPTRAHVHRHVGRALTCARTHRTPTG